MVRSELSSVVCSSDRQLLASRGCPIKIWDAASGACLQTLEGHRAVRSVVFSSNGLRLASAGDRTIKIWDVASGQCIQTDYVGFVFTLSFDPTDSHLLTNNGLIEVSPSPYTIA